MASQFSPTATPFQGKVIAITGGASGIGLALAYYLAARGATLSIADVRQGPLDTAVAEIKEAFPHAKLHSQVVDVTKPDQVSFWIKAVVKEFGSLYGAANLAGVIGKGIGIKRITDLDDDEWNFIMGVNCTGVFNCLREELKVVEKGGSIVSAASIAGLIGFDKNASYVASKHAVVGLTRSAAKEVGEREVRVNCICPGVISTPMVAAADETSNLAAPSTPSAIKRRGKPEEVAALIAYLLGPESTFTSGVAYSIDGGWHC